MRVVSYAFSWIFLLLFNTSFAVAQDNQTPLANAGSDRIVTVGDRVELDGSSSFDPDGQTLYYSWTQSDGPDVDLEGANSIRPEFDVDQVGEYIFRLIVSDGQASSAPDQVQITAIEPDDDDDEEPTDDDAAKAEPNNDDESGCGFQ